MKKTLVVIITIFLVIIAILAINIKAKQDDIKVIQQFNKEYEQYLHKQLYGTEVTTVINKAIENKWNKCIMRD